MGMGTSIVGFMPPTAEFKKKLAAYRACQSAGVPVPSELEKFFGYESPDDAGMVVDIKAAVREWSDDDCASGFEVDVAKLPPGVSVIRFFNSW